LAARIDGDLLRQVAVRHRGGHFRDVAHLVGQVGGHEVHVVGEVLPGAADAADVRLPAELALGTDFADREGDVRGEGVELIDHGVDRVLQLQDLAADLDRDLLGQIAVRHRGGNLRDVADLGGQVTGHKVHAVGEVLPGAADTADVRLPAELAFRTDF